MNAPNPSLNYPKSCIFAKPIQDDTLMAKKLFLLDAMALIYRAYYAMAKSPRMTTTGIDTSATLGFTNTLYEVLKNEKPTHLAVAFDTGAPTLRHADFDNYKANREETPTGIQTAIPYIKRILHAFDIPILELPGYEADDIVGTVAKHAEIEGFEVYMMTSDKDYGQLVSEHIFMYKPAKFGQKAEVVGVQGICEKYGIQKPEQLIDILGLWGDSSDNIPGVPNIGEVKAKKLIAEFGSIENIYNQIDKVSNDKMRQTLLDHKEQAFLSKNLATIILDVPIAYEWETMKIGNFHSDELQAVFDELQFNALKKRIFSELSIQATATENDLFFSAETPMDSSEPTLQTFADTIHHFEEAHEFVLPEKDTVFFDWIFDSEKIIGFLFANQEDIKYYFINNQSVEYKNILQNIFGKNRTVVTYQSKLCYRFLLLSKINILSKVFDLEIAHYLIQPEINHQLKTLASGYLNYQIMEFDKKTVLTQQEMLNLSVERIEIYRQLYPIFSKNLKENNLLALFEEIEMPLVPVLAKMENNGVYLDKEILLQNSKQLNEEIQKIENTIYELAGETFNIGSPKQLGEILFEKLHIIDNAKLTKTKQYQTGEEVLLKLATRHPIIPLVLEWRGLTKLKSTYIDALPLLVNAKTQRIHTTFNQTVTATGRLSSTNPNLQNIPIRTPRGRDIRKAFVAQNDGWLMMAADYSQIELRIVAAVSGDDEMIHTFKTHQDIHALTAAKVYQVDIKDVTPEMRRTAKTVNFGILYGISAFGLADRLMIPQKEARILIEEYYKQFPKIILYLNNTVDFARENGYVETLLNRRRYIRDINSHNGILRKAAERNAINAPIQGTAADLIKIAMIRINQAMTEKKLKSKMVLQVHDELVFEVPKDEVDTMRSLVSQIMNDALQMAVPLETSINFGNSWYDAH